MCRRAPPLSPGRVFIKQQYCQRSFNASRCPGDKCQYTVNQKESHLKYCLQLTPVNVAEKGKKSFLLLRLWEWLLILCQSFLIIRSTLKHEPPATVAAKALILLLSSDWRLQKIPVRRAFSTWLIVIVCKVQCFCAAQRLVGQTVIEHPNNF